MLSILFLLAILPSLFFSKNFFSSLAFYFGTISCIATFVVSCDVSKRVNTEIIVSSLLFVYRFSIVLTFIFVVLKIQDRGHFFLYEPSYWAIYLIPYLCVVSSAIFSGKAKAHIFDYMFIAVAIIISQSASMVIWFAFSLLLSGLLLGKVKLSHVFLLSFFAFLMLFVLILFNDRAYNVYNGIVKATDINGYLNVLIYVAGNRLQRLLVPLYIGEMSPIYGVGGGILRQMAPHMDVNDFSIYGMSATDFTLDGSAPGVNVFFEIFCEHGLLGLLGFLFFLYGVFFLSKNGEKIYPLRLSLLVTLMSLLIESNYMRYYFWALMGVLVGLGMKMNNNRNGAL